MSDMAGCIAEWERDLRRCLQEGRKQPDDETKRLALLKMLPQKQREALWDNADALYPSFAQLLAKVQKMIQDNVDSHNGVGPMDIDNVDEDDMDDQGFAAGGGPRLREELRTYELRGWEVRARRLRAMDDCSTFEVSQ